MSELRFRPAVWMRKSGLGGIREEMGNILNGLVLLILGLILWIVSSVVEAFITFPTRGQTPLIYVMALGFLVMIGGPIVYWIIIPIRNLIQRRHGRGFQSGP